jgi:hypothetical protein
MFNAFFSHVETHGTDIAKKGYEIVERLQLTPKVPSLYTYNLIALQIFKDFVAGYTAPRWAKLSPLRWATNMIDTHITGGMIQEIAGNSKDDLLSKANQQLSKALTKRDLKNKYREYSGKIQLGGMIADHYASSPRDLSPGTHNQAIFNALEIRRHAWRHQTGGSSPPGYPERRSRQSISDHDRRRE